VAGRSQVGRKPAGPENDRFQDTTPAAIADTCNVLFQGSAYPANRRTSNSRYPERSVLRAFYSSCLSVLLLVTLMWGGCISCPQFFMMPKAEKSCCDDAGKCKRQSDKVPVEKECQRMPLEPPSIGGAHHAAAVAVLPTHAPEVLALAIVTAESMHRELVPLEHSPPDLQVLNSTFLI
jgi:hypothetical protein